MASTSAVHAPAIRPARGARTAQTSRPRLTVVSTPKTGGSSMPFALLCTLIVTATLAALLFGFASNLQNVLGAIGSPVPSEFMLMLPYVVTIFAVAGLVGKVRGPAAAGKPYVKG